VTAGARQPVTVEDLRATTAAVQAALRTVEDQDWSLNAGGLTWSCEDTVRHMVSALGSYFCNLAVGSPSRITTVGPRPELTKAELISVIGTAGEVLVHVAIAAPPGRRGFHALGHPDAEGYLAMGCTELLAHTWDVMRGFGQDFDAPDGVCDDVLRRIFPWAPADTPRWQTLLWATGRAELPGHGRLGDDWDWHCDPLEEWDGTRAGQSAERHW